MAAGGDRFDYCKFVELDYVPMETGCMVSMRPAKGYGSRPSAKGLSSSRSPDGRGHSGSAPSTPRSRRSAAASREPCGSASVSSSTSSSCRGSDCSPTKRQHQRSASCTDNHGIRPPPPEQYLTPLQQKEVCIRHLRARLKDTVHTLQDRDSEIDELRGQLCRMQEEWVEEECHRVEAQLALKEARLEIQQLQLAVEGVRARLGGADGLHADADLHDYFKDINAQNHKLENFLVHMELAQARLARDREAGPGRRPHAGGSAPASVSGESPGGVPKAGVAGTLSCSCGSSPARSLTRSSTYTKLSEHAPPERHGPAHGPAHAAARRPSGDGARDSGFVCSGESIPSRAELLLEAAFLSEETASLLSSYTQTLSHSLSHPLSHPPSHPLSSCGPQALAPPLPHSQRSPCSCSGDRLAPAEPLLCALAGAGCTSHPFLSHHHHHHLCVLPLRETGVQTEGASVASCCFDLDTIAEQRTFRSQACSPASTWLSDQGEDELDSVTGPSTAGRPLAGANEGPEDDSDVDNPEGRRKEAEAEAAEVPGPSEDETPGTSAGREEGTPGAESEGRKLGSQIQSQLPFDQHANAGSEGETGEGGDAGPGQPHTSQPRRSAPPDATAAAEETEAAPPVRAGAATDAAAAAALGGGQVQRSYWSRHFWVDLLAVAVPMVPTVAWLCRGPARGAQPMYHFGSLLRGCCTVALHSLRRGGGLRHYPAGGGDPGGSTI